MPLGNPLVGERVVLSDWRDASDEGSRTPAVAAQDAAPAATQLLAMLGLRRRRRR